MPWEPRPGGTYYYRSQRVAGRVTRQYYGRGAAATLAESLDAGPAAAGRRAPNPSGRDRPARAPRPGDDGPGCGLSPDD
jgi:hypothetical protein